MAYDERHIGNEVYSLEYYCPNCGSNETDYDGYCVYCGQKVVDYDDDPQPVEEYTAKKINAGGKKASVGGAKLLSDKGKTLSDNGKKLLQGGKSLLDSGKNILDSGKNLLDNGALSGIGKASSDHARNRSNIKNGAAAGRKQQENATLNRNRKNSGRVDKKTRNIAIAAAAILLVSCSALFGSGGEKEEPVSTAAAANNTTVLAEIEEKQPITTSTESAAEIAEEKEQNSSVSKDTAVDTSIAEKDSKEALTLIASSTESNEAENAVRQSGVESDTASEQLQQEAEVQAAADAAALQAQQEAEARAAAEAEALRVQQEAAAQAAEQAAALQAQQEAAAAAALQAQQQVVVQSTAQPTVVSSGGGESNFNTYDNAAQQQTTETYVLNTNPDRKKIHHPSCSSVKKIAPENYQTTSLSIQELQAQGYTLCGNCFR